ncbi:MAG: enoyl-CoA hydratase/isomerase family protein [Candidatus Latescibacterota bacterium]|nr:MAG: enoyl-CoA hydratase/isomerase family protein [Candidatus Latescibacterota bacterium]
MGTEREAAGVVASSGRKTQKANLRFEHGGAVARVELAAPKANIVDATMMTALEQTLDTIESTPGVKVVVLSAEGPHFSFGASVEEHLPDAIEGTLAKLHALLRRMHTLPAPTLAVVQGQCLGGGLEVVLACDLILAARGAKLACPEIKLGVFAPAASALLPVRIGAGPATRLLLTGASWSADQAMASGLVDRVAPDEELEATLQQWLRDDFLPRSAVGLRHAARAARRGRLRALEAELPSLEKTYLEELMAEPDGVEGVRAFLEKREPKWQEGS